MNAWTGIAVVALPVVPARLDLHSEVLGLSFLYLLLLPGNTAKSSCDVTAIVSVASSGTDTTIGTLVIDVSSSGTSSAGLSRSMNVGDSLKIQIGNGFGDSGCSYLNGVLNVEIS